MVTEYFCTRAGCTPLTAFSKSSRVSSNRLARCTNCSFFAILLPCETLQDHHNHLSSISQQQNAPKCFEAEMRCRVYARLRPKATADPSVARYARPSG